MYTYIRCSHKIHTQPLINTLIHHTCTASFQFWHVLPRVTSGVVSKCLPDQRKGTVKNMDQLLYNIAITYNLIKIYFISPIILLKLTSFIQAAFYFQYGGTPDRSNPFRHGYLQHALNMLDRDILKTRDRQDWINVHRKLYWRNLLKQVPS